MAKADTNTAAPTGDTFVLNSTMGPRTLHRYERDTKTKLVVASETKILGPGLNVISDEWIADANVLDMPPEFGLRVVDPLEVPVIDAVVLVGKTSSRQACERWSTVETRDAVRKALKQRLQTRGPQQVESEND
jgi:hypothetical protein